MNYALLKPVLAGAIIMGCWSIALFFFRFLKQTGDRLFGCFSIAFVLFGVEKLFVLLGPETNPRPYVYLLRLAGFVLIVIGIVNKNRPAKPRL